MQTSWACLPTAQTPTRPTLGQVRVRHQPGLPRLALSTHTGNGVGWGRQGCLGSWSGTAIRPWNQQTETVQATRCGPLSGRSGTWQTRPPPGTVTCHLPSAITPGTGEGVCRHQHCPGYPRHNCARVTHLPGLVTWPTPTLHNATAGGGGGSPTGGGHSAPAHYWGPAMTTRHNHANHSAWGTAWPAHRHRPGKVRQLNHARSPPPGPGVSLQNTTAEPNWGAWGSWSDHRRSLGRGSGRSGIHHHRLPTAYRRSRRITL